MHAKIGSGCSRKCFVTIDLSLKTIDNQTGGYTVGPRLDQINQVGKMGFFPLCFFPLCLFQFFSLPVSPRMPRAWTKPCVLQKLFLENFCPVYMFCPKELSFFFRLIAQHLLVRREKQGASVVGCSCTDLEGPPSDSTSSDSTWLHQESSSSTRHDGNHGLVSSTPPEPETQPELVETQGNDTGRIRGIFPVLSNKPEPETETLVHQEAMTQDYAEEEEQDNEAASSQLMHQALQFEAQDHRHTMTSELDDVELANGHHELEVNVHHILEVNVHEVNVHDDLQVNAYQDLDHVYASQDLGLVELDEATAQDAHEEQIGHDGVLADNELLTIVADDCRGGLQGVCGAEGTRTKHQGAEAQGAEEWTLDGWWFHVVVQAVSLGLVVGLVAMLIIKCT